MAPKSFRQFEQRSNLCDLSPFFLSAWTLVENVQAGSFRLPYLRKDSERGRSLQMILGFHPYSVDPEISWFFDPDAVIDFVCCQESSN